MKYYPATLHLTRHASTEERLHRGTGNVRENRWQCSPKHQLMLLSYTQGINNKRITETHAVAGSDAGAVTLDVKKAGSGVAIASGITLLSSTFNLKSTANTPIVKEGVNLSSDRILIEGDRIGLVTSGTLTALSDVHITIYYKEINQGYIR